MCFLWLQWLLQFDWCILLSCFAKSFYCIRCLLRLLWFLWLIWLFSFTAPLVMGCCCESTFLFSVRQIGLLLNPSTPEPFSKRHPDHQKTRRQNKVTTKSSCVLGFGHPCSSLANGLYSGLATLPLWETLKLKEVVHGKLATCKFQNPDSLPSLPRLMYFQMEAVYSFWRLQLLRSHVCLRADVGGRRPPSCGVSFRNSLCIWA